MPRVVYRILGGFFKNIIFPTSGRYLQTSALNLPSIFSLYTAKWQLCLNVPIMCGVKLNLKKYYLHNKLPNESIMLSNAKS